MTKVVFLSPGNPYVFPERLDQHLPHLEISGKWMDEKFWVLHF